MRGSLRVLVLFDVAEQIDLDKLRELIGVSQPAREPGFKHPSPEYVRFERPPVVEQLAPVLLSAGEQFHCRIKYFDYGVVSLELERPFDLGWEELVRFSSHWISAAEIGKCSLEVTKARMKIVGAATVQPYSSWLSEDYYVIQLHDCGMTAAEMLTTHGGEIARIVRGEARLLSDAERTEALQSSLSYYPSDLLVTGWVAALVYDTPDGAEPTIQLLEYANTQLLQFRHYDEELNRVLGRVYKMVDNRSGWSRRWRMAREAGALNAMRLDVTELTERMDNSIKFLSDMFYARAYRMAATRVGVPDYRTLVERKLRTAGDLYEFMMSQFYQARSFLLEAMVVAILVIELVHLFLRNF
jgi:hypothetical protein